MDGQVVNIVGHLQRSLDGRGTCLKGSCNMSVHTNQETMCKLPDQYFPAEFTPGERIGAGLMVMFFLHPLITQHTSVTVLMFSDVFGFVHVLPAWDVTW